MYLNKLNFLIVAVLSTSINTYALELPPLTHGFKQLVPAQVAPELKLTDIDEEYFDIKSLKGRAVVVNFWATWCPPCRREMPSLEKLRLLTQGKNISIVTVNVGEDIDTVFSFINDLDPTPEFTMLFDTDSSVMSKWKVMGLPTTYVVGPKGRVAYKAVGGREFNHPDIVERIVKLAN
jgi:thiol-disulfide isomerase/thioredoxin